MKIDGIFETHLTVQNLDRSIAFYQEILGLRLLRRSNERNFAFLWAGEPGRSMLGLWEVGTGPLRQHLHFAFRVSLDNLLRAPVELAEKGVTALNFVNQPTDEPVVFPWMPAASIYFQDPDGHSIEFLAMLEAHRPIEAGMMSWKEWKLAVG